MLAFADEEEDVPGKPASPDRFRRGVEDRDDASMPRPGQGGVMAAFARAGAIFALLLTATPADAAAPMTIAFENREQFPYYVGEGEAIDAVRPGIAVEIVAAAAKNVGIDVRFVRLPWKRCLISLRDGRVDAVFNSSFVRERLTFAVYPGGLRMPDPAARIATISYSLYRLRGAGISWDGRAFAGVRGPIGAVIGYSIVGELSRLGVEAEPVGSSRQNFVKMSIGRLSAAALHTVTGDRLLAGGDFPSIERVDPPVAVKDYYLVVGRGFVRDHPDLADRLWAEIAAIRDPMTERLMRVYADDRRLGGAEQGRAVPTSADPRARAGGEGE